MDLQQKVDELEWYHTIDLGNGIVTPGFFDHRPHVPNYGFPDDMRGMHALDVGTFDGFFAFEMERRGADVIAIDVPDERSLDWPAPMLRDLGTFNRFQPKHENFDVAARARGSRVERRFVSAYDVTEKELGTFDYVFVGSLLVHLRDPVRALMALHDVCRGRIHLCEATEKRLNPFRRFPSARFQGVHEAMTWWIPNRACLEDWLVAAGFVKVTHGRTFTLPYREVRGGVRHSVAWAEPGS